MKNTPQVNDLVRALKARNKLGGTLHFYRYGQVVRVIKSGGWDGEPGYVMCIDAAGTKQSLKLHQVKPAKQAMRKRDQYANRRG